MEFTGRIFYSFETYDVWRVYSTALKASQVKGVSIHLEWQEFLVDDLEPDSEIHRKMHRKKKALAACAAVRESHPESHQRFVQALMTLSYQEKDDPGDDTTLAVAAQVAGIDGDKVIARAVDPGLHLLREATDQARELGVRNVPTIIRSGPPVYIKTTGAANYGNPVARLELINRMLSDDGIWILSKP